MIVHHICFILFPVTGYQLPSFFPVPDYLLYLLMVHLMQCLWQKWSILDRQCGSLQMKRLGFGDCRASQCSKFAGSHRCVRRSMLHALEDQALEPCQRSRTALVCLSNSAEGSGEQ